MLSDLSKPYRPWKILPSPLQNRHLKGGAGLVASSAAAFEYCAMALSSSS
jgi:hypothetical protein